ncbi:hypothetical protein [Tunturiibacter gelidoferens]|uniref:Uncharacterized protein n=1 Tax=Tunturiibacter gelidiferens TaxID=3069689 RepID=A0A9X0QIH3_9BACT|nr:hypothetical protein [Edaphobacter lichenicola]MBB5330950.1 hypothetical protein [Edaphobacter lichenicola]
MNFKKEYPLQQQWDPERSGGGGGGGISKTPVSDKPKDRDRAQQSDDKDTTEEWENDKLPKGED